MDKHEAAQRVADHLFDAERALDEALTKMALLVAATTAARPAFGVALKVGAPAISKMSDVTAALAMQREALAAAHDEIAVVQRLTGARPNMTGGGDKPPTPDSRLPALRAVDGEAVAA